jgi:hypothetical protein
MTTPTSGELALLRTQPHNTKLWLSIYKPDIVFQAQVNDAGAAKGDRVITFDNVTTGNYLDIGFGRTLLVGTTAGGKEKGSAYIHDSDSTTITVGENSHINWEDDDYLTVINFNQIWPRYPRYVQSGGDITVYKTYDDAYGDESEGDLGSFIVMGSNFAGFIDTSTGTCQTYWDGSESENVTGATGTTFLWSFEGGDPTGSTAVTPGWVTYDTPGHYRVLLRITSPDGIIQGGYRFVSIYDRPEEGPDVPILSWGLGEFSGSRDEGGYSARIWVKEDVEDVVDGALVVIFADDKYGTTEQSIGGNSPQRESIVFVGYILDGTIEYDYQTSTATFEVGSPTEIMKLGEAFSVSVQDSSNPISDAGTKGGDPWFYLVDLSIKTALFHYYKYHSSVLSLMDTRFVGDDFDIQFFDSDRTSLFDAGSTLLKNVKYGELVCDRQGAMYFETNVAAIDSAESTLPQNMFIDNHDWMDTPSITERYTGEVSYIELGGVAYTNYANGGDGSFSAILSSAPGETPAYRGKNLKMSGFALSTQGQANTLSGNIWESMNAQYPEVSLDMVGNYRNLDIAPQEKVTITLKTEDTFRGLSWVQKAFTPTSMSWNYDPEKGTFLPSLPLKEITQGNAGETIAIPVEPPEEGFEQPPINVPPPIPPLPVPDISWTGTGYLGYAFAPFLGGFDQSANPLHWGSHLTTLALVFELMVVKS